MEISAGTLQHLARRSAILDCLTAIMTMDEGLTDRLSIVEHVMRDMCLIDREEKNGEL